MINVVEDDLLNASEDIIAHQVNCQGKMGSGVAEKIRNTYPEVYSEYKQLCDAHPNGGLLGKVQVVECNDGKYVANIFGQDSYGRDGKKYTSDDALRSALIALAGRVRETKESIAFPYKMSCDRGGGDWSIVYRMIVDYFSTCNVTIYKYNPNKK